MPADPRRVKELFVAALDLADLTERAAFLDRECGDDAELRRRLDVLLVAHDRPDAALGQPFPAPAADEDATRTANPQASTAALPDPAAAVGTVIAGRYKLHQQIGEGGMGTVWMADQLEPVKRRVAVKLIRAERGNSATILSRFEAERQAIALMDHPHIAKLLDAGTADGAPFFVMDLVKGIPLTEYCDTHRLSVPERLNLFMQICSAVQHAHQKGIIHRDLKPSNILVESHDGKPVPKVIDFGLAKATSGLQLTEHTLFTGFGSVMGTPLYMAPEQANFNAIDIDTRADVYALGVILYELLTGTTPLTRESIRRVAFEEMLRLIREQEAPTPSSRLSSSEAKPTVAANRQTEPAKLGRFVKGELDWIVIKALSKDRDRRYETANGFAKDVERFLSHEPVLAGPPSASYRLRKFVQRNKGQVIAGTLILLTLVVGIAGTTIGLVWADQRRIEAEAARTNEELERRRAETAEVETLGAYEASTDETIEHLIGSKPELGPQEKRYLTITLERWQVFAARKGDDPHSLTIRAEGHSRVAYLWDKLNDKEKARTEYQTAKTIWTILVGQFPMEPKYRQKLAQTLHKLSITLASVGKDDEALVETRAARKLIEKLVNEYPDVAEYRVTMAESHRRMGRYFMATKQFDEALKEQELAIDLLQKLVVKSPGVTLYEKELAASYNARSCGQNPSL